MNRGRKKSSEHGACVGFTVIAGVYRQRERDSEFPTGVSEKGGVEFGGGEGLGVRRATRANCPPKGARVRMLSFIQPDAAQEAGWLRRLDAAVHAGSPSRRGSEALFRTPRRSQQTRADFSAAHFRPPFTRPERRVQSASVMWLHGA